MSDHPGIENVCFKANYALGALFAGLVISGVALWWGILAH